MNSKMNQIENNPMASWWALCRREWLEHKIALLWGPLGVLGLVILGLYLTGNVIQEELAYSENFDIQKKLLQVSWPFTWLYLALAVTVLLSSLIEERKNRTILFWKSMPVSDTATVFSKIFVVCGIGALINVAVILCAQLAAILVTSLFPHEALARTGLNLWANAHLGISALNWLSGYATQIFWQWPLWGWLVFVSAFARGNPLIRVIAIPAVLVFLEGVLLDSSYLITSIGRHLDLRALPTSFTPFSHDGSTFFANTQHFAELAQLWGSASMWLGIVTGSLFIAGAIFFRNRNNEL